MLLIRPIYNAASYDQALCVAPNTCTRTQLPMPRLWRRRPVLLEKQPAADIRHAGDALTNALPTRLQNTCRSLVALRDLPVAGAAVPLMTIFPDNLP